jgi:hypothetical protein
VLNLLRSVVVAGLGFFKTRRQLAIEVLALRHQLGVLKRSLHPRVHNRRAGPQVPAPMIDFGDEKPPADLAILWQIHARRFLWRRNLLE